MGAYPDGGEARSRAAASPPLLRKRAAGARCRRADRSVTIPPVDAGPPIEDGRPMDAAMAATTSAWIASCSRPCCAGCRVGLWLGDLRVGCGACYLQEHLRFPVRSGLKVEKASRGSVIVSALKKGLHMASIVAGIQTFKRLVYGEWGCESELQKTSTLKARVARTTSLRNYAQNY